MRARGPAVLLLGVLAATAGCSEPSAAPAPSPAPVGSAPATAERSAPPTASAAPGPATEPDAIEPSRVRRAWLRIPALGGRRMRLLAYRGTADDLPGTRIQDRGLLASPRGPRGGVGPGAVGNMVVTGHRTSAGGPLRDLPQLVDGDHVLVEAAGRVYDYRITRTLRVSFRSARERASQSAPVPGRLGVAASRAMITLSTCATPEDHAAGNFWADALGNPEHRIAKVGVLVAVRDE